MGVLVCYSPASANATALSPNQQIFYIQDHLKYMSMKD